MAGKREENPAGSSNNLRGDVLRVLGVLKVATVEQIQQISAPHLSYRHTDKDKPSKRKQARTASHLGALSDLRNLTPMGLKAASYELGRPVGEMGNPARGAGRTGASHPMVVNDAVLALLRPKPDLAQLVDEPAEVLAAAQAAVDAPDGLGTIASYATEVALPATGTWSNPGKGGAQADIVITSPEDGVPLLFVEIDNCYESAQVLAAKIDKYMRFGQRKVKDADGKERPMWRTRWWVPDGRHGDQPHPPLLLVFNRVGPRNPNTVIAQLAELTRRHWQGTAHDGFHMYDGKLPIVVTGMKQLQEHGPAGAIFRRFGCPQNQTLLEAIGNPRREANDARQRAEYEVREREYKEQLRRVAQERKAERESRRPVCAGCGARFTDERWEAAHATDWGAPKDTHPHLCDDCKQRAVAAEGQAAGKQEHQEPVRHGAEQQNFQREAHRPVCTECGANFTDERWKAIEHVGWGVPQEPRPSLCDDCDQRFVTDVHQAWPDEHRHQEQGQPLPEQKAGGTWLSRFRR
ncbi:replication-relaxation family protein [Streptomyces sp. NPDC059153]|uniref:replication-relaxation family protein n=1 Tax=Streptomyces sp. NPDC059153 TaxID=3346743 RepID=UPI00367C583D